MKFGMANLWLFFSPSATLWVYSWVGLHSISGESGHFMIVLRPLYACRHNNKAVLGRWGLVPAQTRPDYLPKALKLPTSNARWETANERYSFRNAWSKKQRCIVPAESIFEPDWRTGKSIPTRFTRSDGAPIAVAGLWDAYKNEAGQWEFSYTMLTMNADDHPLFKHYHREGKEKRMVLILPEESYEGWLDGEDAAKFFRPFEPEKLIARPAGEEQQRTALVGQ